MDLLKLLKNHVNLYYYVFFTREEKKEKSPYQQVSTFTKAPAINFLTVYNSHSSKFEVMK